MIKIGIEYDKVPGIYRIVNIANNREYIGSSKSLYRRACSHRYRLNSGVHHSLPLQNAHNKYGEEVFDFEIIELCSIEALLSREQFYIDGRKPYYNVAKFSNSGMRGRAHSKKTKHKISKALSKKFTKEELRDRALYALSFANTPEADAKRKETVSKVFSSEEHKCKLRKTQKELWSNADYVAKMSEAHKHYTPEIRKKLSDAQKLLWNENRERFSIARRGKGKAKITETQVREMRELSKSGMSCAKIGKIYNLKRNSVWSIVSGKNWKWVK